MSERAEFDQSEIYKEYAKNWLGDAILVMILVGLFDVGIILFAPSLTLISLIITVIAGLYIVYCLFEDINELIIEHIDDLEGEIRDNKNQ